MGLLDGILKGYTDAVLGPAPTDVGGAYQKLQESINTRYDTDKQKFEADPANSGKSYQLPDPLTRWYDQIQGMITSGDPVLQKEGLSQLSQYQQRATASTTNEAPASVKEFQYAKANGFGGSYTDWKQLNNRGNNISVNVNSGQGVEGINFLSEADKERLHLPQNTAYYVNKSGEIKEAPGGQDIATQQQTNVTDTTVTEVDDLLFGNNGVYEKTKKAINNMNVPESLKRPGEAGYALYQQYAQDDPAYAQVNALTSNLASTIGRAYLGEKGVMTDEDVSRIKKIIPDPIRDNEETARAKMAYLKKLLNTTDPTKVRNMVYKNNQVNKSTDKSLNKATAKEPAWQQTQSGVKYRIVE